MHEFIHYKDLLLTQYEYDRGERVDPKVMDKRHKLLEKGEVKIIQDRDRMRSSVKIERKK